MHVIVLWITTCVCFPINWDALTISFLALEVNQSLSLSGSAN